MQFLKYHGLGNDYLVMEADAFDGLPSEAQIIRICHRNYGVGSDGILLGPLPSETCDFGLKIFNPDGSEAEKSGNGLRIFSRYLFDTNRVTNEPFTIETLGGNVQSEVHGQGEDVTVEMGHVTFDSSKIPVAGETRDVLNETLVIDGESLTMCCASVGNPHCVVLREQISEADALRFGPHIETHAQFPNRINVQLLQVIDRANISIQIWERGAGYTLASGSSSTAAAAVAHKLGLCDSAITVHMPGGTLSISFTPDFCATMTGPVTPVASGIISPDAFA
ncbi:MAG: diaminopimelate epimerase [Kiritimatiellae bacterium]|nr:diaminopimelate epimerase [Kiritimatiellia bacterium]